MLFFFYICAKTDLKRRSKTFLNWCCYCYVCRPTPNPVVEFSAGLPFSHALLAAKFSGMQRFHSRSFLRGSTQKSPKQRRNHARFSAKRKREKNGKWLNDTDWNTHNIAFFGAFGPGKGLTPLIMTSVFCWFGSTFILNDPNEQTGNNTHIVKWCWVSCLTVCVCNWW